VWIVVLYPCRFCWSLTKIISNYSNLVRNNSSEWLLCILDNKTIDWFFYIFPNFSQLISVHFGHVMKHLVECILLTTLSEVLLITWWFLYPFQFHHRVSAHAFEYLRFVYHDCDINCVQIIFISCFRISMIPVVSGTHCLLNLVFFYPFLGGIDNVLTPYQW
jgi:hypothetical protein